MAKRPDSLETTILLLEILKRIPRKSQVTATDLHKQLQNEGFIRDLHTIQRHLDMLSEHFDIDRDERSKPYGYRWLEQAQGISLPSLTVQESLLLSLAERQLRLLLPQKLMKSMSGFFDQARRNLRQPSTAAQRERQWLKKVRVVATSQPLMPPVIDDAVFEQVSTALYDNRVLLIEYKNAAGEIRKSRVWPLGLAQQGPRLYLVCRFSGYDNERCLALHRFIKAEVLMEQFPYPSDFDLEKFDEDGRFGYGQGQRIQLHFHITKDAGFHLTESPLSLDQKVIEHEEHYEITATVVDSAMLIWWLRGFGEEVWGVERSDI